MGLDVTRVIATLADAGLDLVHAFDARAIGELARAEGALAAQERTSSSSEHGAQQDDGTSIAADSRARASHHGIGLSTIRPLAAWARLAEGPRLGLLVGNTRALWPRFVAARDSLPAKDPLDAYVVRAIERVIVSDERVFYAHRAYDGAFLPFQPLAVATGFAAMSDGGLAVHPIYGPWFALRAVITLDASLELAPPVPIAKACICSGACERALEIARGSTGDWRAWLAVRDACSLRAWRYSDEQIQFHYASAWPDAGRG